MLQIRAPNNKWSKYVQGSAMWINERQIEGVITSCSLISTSADESLYEIRLEHKLALLSRRRRSAIYLNINVPKLVTQILKEHFLLIMKSTLISFFLPILTGK